MLQESFVAEGIGTMVGQATTIFAGTEGSVNAEIARHITNTAIDSVLNLLKKQKKSTHLYILRFSNAKQ